MLTKLFAPKLEEISINGEKMLDIYKECLELRVYKPQIDSLRNFANAVEDENKKLKKELEMTQQYLKWFMEKATEYERLCSIKQKIDYKV